MRPDDPRHVPDERAATDDGLVAFAAPGVDPELDALAAELAAAGARARAGAPTASLEAPRGTFAADLRSRLMAQLPEVAAVGAPPNDRPRPNAPIATEPEPLTRRPVTPRITTPLAAFVPTPRWMAMGVAAALIVAILGVGPSRLLTGVPDLRAGDAVGASLTRDGSTTGLRPDVALRVGDLVTTAPAGHATLELGKSIVRLAGGSAIRLDAATADLVELDQAAGRAWHRVGGEGVTYVVRTQAISWTADGTAFSLGYGVDAAGSFVRGIGVEHSVAIAARGLSARLDAGAVATIRLDGIGDVPRLELGPATVDDLTDPWLVANASDDLALGFDPGVIDVRLADATPAPTPSPPAVDPAPIETEPAASAVPSADPSDAPAGPTIEPDATPRPTARPTETPRPTPRPTATPKPAPKPTPSLGSLGLTATACPGGFTSLAWTKAPATGFDHYQTIRSTSSSIPAVEPPVAPGVAPDALYAASLTTLSAIDNGPDAGTYRYRTVAFGADGRATAASDVRTVTLKPVGQLGSLVLTPTGGGFVADWSAFEGPATCFTWYKLVASDTDTTPSYLEGAPYVWAGESLGTSSASVPSMDAGTWHVRLQVLRESAGDPLLVAETDVADITIP